MSEEKKMTKGTKITEDTKVFEEKKGCRSFHRWVFRIHGKNEHIKNYKRNTSGSV
jgi:hypothetical protein